LPLYRFPTVDMSRKIKEITPDRRLTDGEAAKYREVRALVAAELAELRARTKWQRSG
jgi:hypothetical protein